MEGRLRNKEIAQRFGRNLFHARHHTGFSQEELARLTSLHRTEISLIERGRRLPRVDTLIKLFSALAEELLKLYVEADELRSPKELTLSTNQQISNVGHHVRVLAEKGAIELITVEPRRGSIEHF